MARKQTRRSISMSGVLYKRLSAYAEQLHLSRSSIIERLIKEELDRREAQ